MPTILVRIGSLIGLGIAGFLLGSSVATGQTGSLEAEAQALLEQSPTKMDIAPGEVLYIRDEYYDRHGPKHEEIQLRGGPVTTETSVRETWYEVGQRREVVRAVSRVTDADGRTVQVDSSSNEGVQSVDTLTNELIYESGPEPQVAVDNLTQVANIYIRLIAGGTVKVVSVLGDEIVVEAETGVQQRKTHEWQSEGFVQVPFYHDLGSKTLIVQTSIHKDGTARKSLIYAATDGGDRILVSSITTTDIMVVEQFPEDLFLVPDRALREAGDPVLFVNCSSGITCIDQRFNSLGGVNLEAFDIVHIEHIGTTDGVWTYNPGAYSHASTSINSVSVSATAGHRCNFGTFFDWSNQQSLSNATHAEIGTTVNVSPVNCTTNWSHLNSASHNLVDDFFGWSPTTYVEWFCQGLMCGG